MNKMKENLPRKDVYSKAVDNNSVKTVVKKSSGEPKPVPRPKCAINVNILPINFTGGPNRVASAREGRTQNKKWRNKEMALKKCGIL